MGVNYVRSNDITDAAMVALLDRNKHRNTSYQITGPISTTVTDTAKFFTEHPLVLWRQLRPNDIVDAAMVVLLDRKKHRKTIYQITSKPDALTHFSQFRSSPSSSCLYARVTGSPPFLSKPICNLSFVAP
jgi:hypothetical protein